VSGVIPLLPPTCLHGVDRDNFTFVSADSPSTSADATRVARTVTDGPLKRDKRHLVYRYTTHRPIYMVENSVTAATVQNLATMQISEVTSKICTHISHSQN
jgi:hypothetical protein